MYSIELLQAISDWQRGGSPEQKLKRANALKKACQNLPDVFKVFKGSCYRQIALNHGAVWTIGTEYQLNESISSWTTSLEVAKSFKGGVPPKDSEYQGIILELKDNNNYEVIVNISDLFNDAGFCEYLDKHKNSIDSYHHGLGRYGDEQKEVVINVDMLPLSSLIAWGGYSGSKIELATMYFGHTPNSVELTNFENLMNQSGRTCGANWLTTPEAVRRVSEKLKYHAQRLKPIKELQDNI